MNCNLLTKMFAGMAIFTSMLPMSSPVSASSDKYSCLEVNGIHGIYSRTERGNINFLNFTQDVSEDWTTNKRCTEVATRFQRYYDNGIMRFVSAGYINSQPALCAVVEKGEACSSNNLLVTLPTNTDPIKAARQLMDTRGLANGRVIAVNGKKGRIESYVNGNTYYDLELLEKLVLEQENSDRLIKN